MKLDTLHQRVLVPHTHDGPVGQLGRTLKPLRQCMAIDNQRVVPRPDERVGQSVVDSASIVTDLRHLSMHGCRGADDLATEGCADALVTEAHTQDRDMACQLRHQRRRDAGLVRGAGARRNHHRGGLHRSNLARCGLIVPEDADVARQLAQVLHEVVGERIVVVDNNDHGRGAVARSRYRVSASTRGGASTFLRFTLSIAFTSALALFTVSTYSRSGTESATIPAPACT